MIMVVMIMIIMMMESKYESCIYIIYVIWYAIRQ